MKETLADRQSYNEPDSETNRQTEQHFLMLLRGFYQGVLQL